jgi:hypothetical protein
MNQKSILKLKNKQFIELIDVLSSKNSRNDFFRNRMNWLICLYLP